MLVCQVALLRSFKYISRYLGVHKNIKAPAGSHSLSLKTSLARYQSGFAKMWQTSLQKLQNTWLHFTMTHLYDAPCIEYYRIFTYIWLKGMVNVGKSSIHGAYGIWMIYEQTGVTTEPPNIHLCNGTIGIIGGEVPNFGGLTQPTHVQSPMQVVSLKMWMWMMWMFRSCHGTWNYPSFFQLQPPRAWLGFCGGPCCSLVKFESTLQSHRLKKQIQAPIYIPPGKLQHTPRAHPRPSS